MGHIGRYPLTAGGMIDAAVAFFRAPIEFGGSVSAAIASVPVIVAAATSAAPHGPQRHRLLNGK
jgi:hypothetical protein